jgi:ABC-type multidrug transport system ATPase subunit
MLLDEPTKELDPEVADIILKKIKSIAKNALVIVVTHSASDAEKLNAKILNI